MSNSLETQVGGNHYIKMKIQPIEQLIDFVESFKK